MSGQVVHWEIGASDAEKSRSFYRELFGWEITPAGPDYSLVAGVDGGVGGGIMQVSGSMPTYLTFYVTVEDVESAPGRAVALGATEQVGPTQIPSVGRFAMFGDPDEHTIGILEPLSGEERPPPTS